jgi:lipid A oxidase
VGHFKLVAAALAISASSLALAESEFTVYSGYQSSPHSTVENTNTGKSFYTGWDGDPWSFPIYLGLRYTEWVTDDWGYAVNYAHTKAYSSDLKSTSNTGASGNSYTRLEFTDGANPVTVIAMRRFKYRNIRPHVGAGIGISVPHVEVTWSSNKTFEYQYGGPVATVLAGFNYPINDKWNLLTEFQMHYMKLDVAITGGRLKTNLITNALNVGVSYRF